MMHLSLDAPPADSRATELHAADAQGEHYSGFTLMVEAYAAIWLILMIWLALVWRKATSLTARVDGLEKAIARAEGARRPPAKGEAAT
jgi:hypothetical protein